MIYRPPAEIGMTLDDVDTPALLIDRDAFDDNVRRLAEAAGAFGVALRPHAKTHKSPAIARRQIAAGAVGVCCQKVAEAEAMVEGGVSDVLVTNEIVGAGKLLRLASLAKQAKVGVCVDDAANVAELSAAASRLGAELSVLVEVDVGAHKCGVAPGEAALELARCVAGAPALRFAGLQAYHGPAQHIRDHAERRAAIEAAVAMVTATVDLLARHGLRCGAVTGAGTGTYPFEAASGVYTELQAGSYIFMDADYRRNLDARGVHDSPFAHSLFVLATVMSRPVGERAVLDAGLKAVSVDSGMPLLVDRPGVDYVGAADEHGKLALRDPVEKLAVGDKVRLIPGHCDPTVNLHDWFIGYRRDRVEAIWPVAARGPGF